MSDQLVQAETADSPSHEIRRRDGLMVVGMHRSGTSAVAGSLVKLGAEPPAHLLGASEGNPRGHWESTTLIEFHDRVLASAGSDWRDWRQFNPDWYATQAALQYRIEGRQLLESEFGDSPMLVLKDPRICRFLPLWLDIFADLGISPKAVLPIRLPLEVAQSLHARDGMPLPQGLLLWLRHVLDSEFSTRDVPRYILQWDSFLADWRSPVLAMQQKLDLLWPRYSDSSAAEIDSFLGQELKREWSTEEASRSHPDMHAWVMAVYEAMVGLTQDAASKRHRKTLDDIRVRFNDVSQMFGRPLAALEQQLFTSQAKLFALQAQERRSIEEQAAEASHRSYIQQSALATSLSLEQSLSVTQSSFERRQQGIEEASSVVEARYRDVQRVLENISAQVSLLEEQRRRTDEQLSQVSHHAGTGYSALDGRASYLEQLASTLNTTSDKQAQELQDLQLEVEAIRQRSDKVSTLLDSRISSIENSYDGTKNELAQISATQDEAKAVLNERMEQVVASVTSGFSAAVIRENDLEDAIQTLQSKLGSFDTLAEDHLQAVSHIQSRLDIHSEKLEEATGITTQRVAELEATVSRLEVLIAAKSTDVDVINYSYQQLRKNIDDVKRQPVRYFFSVLFRRAFKPSRQ